MGWNMYLSVAEYQPTTKDWKRLGSNYEEDIEPCKNWSYGVWFQDVTEEKVYSIRIHALNGFDHLVASKPREDFLIGSIYHEDDVEDVFYIIVKISSSMVIDFVGHSILCRNKHIRHQSFLPMIVRDGECHHKLTSYAFQAKKMFAYSFEYETINSTLWSNLRFFRMNNSPCRRYSCDDYDAIERYSPSFLDGTLIQGDDWDEYRRCGLMSKKKDPIVKCSTFMSALKLMGLEEYCTLDIKLDIE